MKTTNIKSIIFILAISMAISTLTLAQHQHNSDPPEKETMKMGCCKDMNQSESEVSPDSTVTSDQMIIDLEKIDKNKDGKVFVDGMCKDVVKDEPGNCPKCGMILKEVSIEEVKNDLLKNGFKVK